MTGAWRKRWERLGEFVRAVIGAPSYDRYLAHIRSAHPNCVPLARSEFMQAQLNARYDRPGSRCC